MSEPKGKWMENNFTRGEPDLLVFISSVMDDELSKARYIVQKVFRESPITRPWAFEYTPASSTSPEDEYLEKVRCADFVVWLVGSKTTLPVVNEINTCMNNSRRLLIFRLPTNNRDQKTNDLLSNVKNYAKWQDVNDIADLAKHVEDALSDEIVKALQDPALPARRKKIEELYRTSLSRCKQMWRTLNVPENVATELSEDTSVGDLLGSPCSGLYVVFGDQGSGKTLAAERLFQRWLKQSLEDSSQPFPLFINSRDLSEPLNEYINKMTQGYSSPAIQGATIIIDGIDEIGLSQANSLLEQIRVFADANPKAVIIITSRQLPGLNVDGVKQIELSTMEDEKITDLIIKMAGRAIDRFEMYEWSESIQDAIRYPLFAVMMGVTLRNNPNFTATRRNQLVNLFAQKTAKDAEENDWLLQKLAAETIKIGTRVNKSTISKKQFEQNMLINSRLVNEQDGKVDFTLSIFREFYAARAIIEETISINSTMPVSDRWLMSMAIVMEEDEERGNELIHKLVSSDPGFASLLLKELVSRWDDHATGTISLGTPEEVGQEIWTAMDNWRQGLGKLFSIIGPVSSNGGTATLGIDISGYRIVTSWYRGTDLPSVVKLSEHMDGETQDENWPTLSFQDISYTAYSQYWPWIWTKKFLVHTLSESIKSNRLVLESKDAVRELVWDFSCNVYKFSAVELTEISVREILHFIEKLRDFNGIHFGNSYGVQFWDCEIKSIKSHLMKLLENGVDTISAPWPSADEPMSSSSGAIYYSGQRLLDRTNAIYTGALSIYETTIDQWFGPFDKQLELIRPRPAKLEGGLVLPDRQDVLSIDPILTRAISPLSAGEESIATFKIMSQEMCDEFIKSHRETREFWSYSSGILQDFGSRPATEIACKWLIDDLRELGWAERYH